MPETIEGVIYVVLSAVTAASVCGVIPWLVNKGFNAMVTRISAMEAGINSLRVDIQTERESRLVHYGKLTASIAEHRAICDERHGRGK
jgi:hypothetical protein